MRFTGALASQPRPSLSDASTICSYREGATSGRPPAFSNAQPVSPSDYSVAVRSGMTGAYLEGCCRLQCRTPVERFLFHACDSGIHPSGAAEISHVQLTILATWRPVCVKYFTHAAQYPSGAETPSCRVQGRQSLRGPFTLTRTTVRAER